MRLKPTTEVAVVLLATLAVTGLGLGSPVGHTAQLVALGEGSVGDAVEHVVSSSGRTPRVLSREGSHQISDGNRSHFEVVNGHRKSIGVGCGL